MPCVQVVSVRCVAFDDVSKFTAVRSDEHESHGFAGRSGGSSGEVGIAQCRRDRSAVDCRTVGDGIQRLYK